MINLKRVNLVNINPSNFDMKVKYIFFKIKDNFSKGKKIPSLREFILKNNKKRIWENYFLNNSLRELLKKTYNIKEHHSILKVMPEPKVKITRLNYKGLC